MSEAGWVAYRSRHDVDRVVYATRLGMLPNCVEILCSGTAKECRRYAADANRRSRRVPVAEQLARVVRRTHAEGGFAYQQSDAIELSAVAMPGKVQ